MRIASICLLVLTGCATVTHTYPTVAVRCPNQPTFTVDSVVDYHYAGATLTLQARRGTTTHPAYCRVY